MVQMSLIKENVKKRDRFFISLLLVFYEIWPQLYEQYIDSMYRGIIAATPKETLQAKKSPNVCDLKTMRANDRLNMPETFLCVAPTA